MITGSKRGEVAKLLKDIVNAMENEEDVSEKLDREY